MYYVLCILYCVLCTLCTLCTLYTMYSVLCVLCTLCTLYYVLCTLYTVYSVLYVTNNSSIQPPHSLTTWSRFVPRLAWVRGYLFQTIVLTVCSAQWDTQFATHFSSLSDLFCCSALARAMAPVPVTPVCVRLQWDTQEGENTTNLRLLHVVKPYKMSWSGHIVHSSWL